MVSEIVSTNYGWIGEEKVHLKKNRDLIPNQLKKYTVVLRIIRGGGGNVMNVMIYYYVNKWKNLEVSKDSRYIRPGM